MIFLQRQLYLLSQNENILKVFDTTKRISLLQPLIKARIALTGVVTAIIERPINTNKANPTPRFTLKPAFAGCSYFCFFSHICKATLAIH